MGVDKMTAAEGNALVEAINKNYPDINVEMRKGEEFGELYDASKDSVSYIFRVDDSYRSVNILPPTPKEGIAPSIAVMEYKKPGGFAAGIPKVWSVRFPDLTKFRMSDAYRLQIVPYQDDIKALLP